MSRRVLVTGGSSGIGAAPVGAVEEAIRQALEAPHATTWADLEVRTV